MILTDEVNIFISNKIIGYYRGAGYDIVPNSVNCIKVKDLLKYSTVRIDVKCDICGFEKNLSYQKYNKNIEKYNIYTCNSSCAQFKNKLTLKKLYGSDNFNRSEENKLKTKEKYDKITDEINYKGYINCIKCNTDRDLSEYLVKNGRYKHICRLCRNKKSYDNRNKSPHIKAWRSVLRGYFLRMNLKKHDKTHNLLKYSSEEFKQHISNLFTGNMSWDNYGTWHIDHVVHLTLFKNDTPCHIVNSLKNLRPLESFRNISRHNFIDDDCLKMIPEFQTYIKEEYIINKN
jgi:hypothetical protein